MMHLLFILLISHVKLISYLYKKITNDFENDDKLRLYIRRDYVLGWYLRQNIISDERNINVKKRKGCMSVMMIVRFQ